LNSAITIKCSKPFRPLYNLPKDTEIVVCIGGRGGMKTYEVSKYVCFKTTVQKKRCIVLRDEKSLIKDSILNEIFTRYDKANEYGGLDSECLKLKTGIIEKSTGKELVYTKGFRASALEKKANMKGPSDIDIALLEEFEDVRSPEEFDTFIDGLRKEGCLIVILMNVPDLGHFIIKRYFTAEKTQYDGYFTITPKSIPGFVCIQTNYKDNPFLPDNIIRRYEDRGNPESHLYDLHYYLTSILGYASTGRKGQILTKVKPIKLIDYLALPFKEIYGQDFGTSSPAGMVGAKFDKNNCYCRQMNYAPMDVLSIGKMYASLKFGANDKIIADSAEPLTIKRLKSGWKKDEMHADDYVKYPLLEKGFYVEPAPKGPGSIKTGIELMTGMNLFAVEESTDLWNEIYNWIYAVDKNHQPTDEPEDAFNHLIDPLRYIITYYKGIGGSVKQMAGYLP
jgi:PBSX family phage terminase large subunit